MPDLLAYSGLVACLVVLGLLVVESGLFVGVILPGDSLLFGAGLLVGTGAIQVPVAVLAASAWTGAVLGDTLGYGVGRWCGHSWLARGRQGRGRRFLAAAERMYARHGWFAIVICRWYPGIRAIVPTLAGVGRMHPVRFAAANALGALLWAVGMVLLGYAAAAVPWVRDAALWAMAVSIALTMVYALVHAVRRRREGRRWDERASSPSA
jgi:membrane-associated protein